MLLRTLAGLLLLAFITVPGISAPISDRDEVKMPESVRKATARGLEYLARQQASDGSWGESRYPHNTAITSFALLAFLSQGHLPYQGLYGPEIGKGVRYLLTSAREDGYLAGPRGGNMYCHGMATLALAEVWGMTGDTDVKPVLKKAVDLIVGCQSIEGGWRYEPRPIGADISVTIMQVMALRAAKNSGLHVKEETLTRAIAYINRCYHEASGGFTYQPNRTPGFARTAAGVCVLQLTGKYEDAKIRKAVEYLEKNFESREHFWYGHYYAAHAMHQVGGQAWRSWYDRLVSKLLPLQQSDGSWSGDRGERVGPVYQTAIAVLALSVPMNYLPIYQR